MQRDWVYLWNPLVAGLIAPLVVFIYLPFFRRLNLTTVYEYLEKRFHVAVRLFASSAFVLFHLGRMAIVLFLPAIALSAVTGIDVYACIVVMGILCTVYTVLGGIEAVIWTDFLQVIVLIGGALISLVIIAANVEGGFSGIVSVGMADSKFHAVNWTWDMTTTAIWVMVIGNIFVNLVPYTSDQAVVQRYFTTKDGEGSGQGDLGQCRPHHPGEYPMVRAGNSPIRLLQKPAGSGQSYDPHGHDFSLLHRATASGWCHRLSDSSLIRRGDVHRRQQLEQRGNGGRHRFLPPVQTQRVRPRLPNARPPADRGARFARDG